MRQNRFTSAAGALVAAIGAAALVGWLLDNAYLTSIAPGLNSMKVNTALCFVVAGAALLVGRRASWVVAVAGAGILAIALATLFEYVSGAELGIDELLFTDQATVNTTNPGRMGLNTALCFTFVGSALLLLFREPRRRRVLAAQACALAALAIASFALAGYMAGVEALYGVASHTAMALHAGVALLLLSLAILAAAPEHGLPATVLARTPGGRVARRLLPVTLVVPLVLGALRVVSERLGVVSHDVGLWIFVAIVIAIFATASVAVARMVDAGEGVRSELRETHSMLAAIVDSSREAIITVGVDRNVASWNSGAERLYGWTAAEIVGRPVDLLLPLDRAHEFGRLKDQLAAGSSIELETVRVAKDGTLVEVSLSVWPLLGSSGEVAQLASISRDIGEQRRTQRQLEAMALKLATSNAELERFAAVASHDLREPLRKIQSFATLLERSFAADLPEEARQHLGRMSAAAARMETLIEGVLELSRATQSAASFELVSLTRVGREVLDDLEMSIANTGARVEVADLPELDADPLQMRQLLQNLIANALKFRNPDAAPEIAVRGALVNGVAELTVADNGIGFEQHHAERIFGPFQRLHGRSDYPGTGLGLALCHRIAERHGGSISARSTPGAGATFTVKLPVSQPMKKAA